MLPTSREDRRIVEGTHFLWTHDMVKSTKVVDSSHVAMVPCEKSEFSHINCWGNRVGSVTFAPGHCWEILIEKLLKVLDTQLQSVLPLGGAEFAVELV